MLPVGADIAGFGTDAMNTYLRSPNFQANSSLGSVLGMPGAVTGSNLFPAAPTTGVGTGGLFSMDGLKLGIGGLSAIAGIWNAFQAQKLARDSFNFQKDYAETNLANQIKSYNTALNDRARSRGFTEGQTQDQIDQYINDNKLKR